MKKLNNSGYVLSIILFGVLIVFLTVFSVLILTMDNSFKLDKILKQNIIKDIELNEKICKRATALHEETCSRTDYNGCVGAGYVTGSIITYGNDPETRVSGTLTSGDAFDCDVTGAGNYERFYYVTDLEENSNYAVLIYYNNVNDGEVNDSALYAYVSKEDYVAAGGEESDYGIDGNWNKGPLTLVKQLPTISQWSKVSLTNTSRNIKDETSIERINNFSYEGYAARLLTYQEMTRACGTENITNVGYLDNCKYLLENTQYSSSGIITYGFWLENPYPYESTSSAAWSVFGLDRIDNNHYVSTSSIYGVRPVIEVLKSNISY